MPAVQEHPTSAIVVGVTALICALWIAICAAAPEFIWQGIRIAVAHPSWADFLSALLIGLILAFFIEPIMDRLRDLLRRPHRREATGRSQRGALFTACVSLAFALASVSLHDAMTEFVANRDDSGGEVGLIAGVLLTTAWAMVPFFIALAWQGARDTWLAVPTGVLAAVSPCLAGWLFSWSLQSTALTLAPCLLILYYGNRQSARSSTDVAFAQCARVVATVGAAWLILSLLVDVSLALIGAAFRLYSTVDFWIDARFYLGWTLGLLLAPRARPRREKAGLSG
ncbi:MAG TPA: hypothetical protein VEK35_09605 [Roseiarcus sp.]|nr:hypothetical protein [Roseiarcus sp.]